MAYSSASGRTREALTEVAFALDKGKVGAIVGPSGCGKTTLLRIVAGLDSRFVGFVARPEPVHLAVVFQEPRLLPWRSVEDNVRLVVPDVAEGELADPERVGKAEEGIRGAQDRLASLRARLEAERAAVEKVRAARAAAKTADAKPSEARAAIDAAAAELAKIQGEEPLLSAEVDGPAVSRVVAAWTGVPVGKMRSDQVKAVLDLEARLTISRELGHNRESITAVYLGR